MDNRSRPPKLYGTPVSSFLRDAQEDRDTGPINRRRQRLEKSQIVQDDQGRRRFHGAFTGGFSAGYHNTVDSVQGFQPKSFTSRRGARAQDDGPSFQHKPEDYMDDEDFSEFGIAPKKVRLTGQFSDALGLTESTSRLGIPLVVNDCIGEKILRHMTRNRTATCTKHDDIPEFKPKNDYHGLGYKPLTSKSSELVDGPTQSPLEASLKSGSKLKISGEAFGVGVFDEDEDNLHNLNEYGYDDLANYDFNPHKSSKSKSELKISSNSDSTSRQPNPDDPNLLPGFVLAKGLSAIELCDKECLDYPLPIIEEGWKMPVRIEPIIMPREESDLNRKVIDSHSSRVTSLSDKFTCSEPSQAKKFSDIERRSGLVLYSDLKTFVKPVTHDQEPVKSGTTECISLSRQVVDWYPCSLLCKHFGVENPYPGNKFCGVKPKDLKSPPAKGSDEQFYSTQTDDIEDLAPIEIRKSIFNVYFREPDNSDSDQDLENEPQVVELESDDKLSGSEKEAQLARDGVTEEFHHIDNDLEVVVMDVPKKEPEVIVLSSSDSSDSEDAYGPPLPPSRQTLTGLDLYRQRGQSAHSSWMKSDKSHKHKKHKDKKKKRHKKRD